MATSQKKLRLLEFDILKLIGLIGIILAHTIDKSTLLYQIRSFDVPLMVIVSGALYWASARQKQYKYFEYLKKRLPRLLFPTWLFLGFFFLFEWVDAWYHKIQYPFDLTTIVNSMTLLSGIGYVWIIRIFILIALISPFLISLKKKYNQKQFLILIFIVYFIYEILFFLAAHFNWIVHEPQSLQELWINKILIERIFLIMLPYGCLFAIGLMLGEINQKKIIKVVICTSISLIFTVASYSFNMGSFIFNPSDYKTPSPQLYFVTYGLLISLLMYLFIDLIYKKITINKYVKKAIVFMSDSSLWIYLWHIFFLFNWKLFLNIFNLENYNFQKFLGILLLSILTTCLQKKIVFEGLARLSLSQEIKQWVAICFLK